MRVLLGAGERRRCDQHARENPQRGETLRPHDLLLLDGSVREWSGDTGVQSSSVLMSPTGSPWSQAFSTRRMIFPLRVFGSLSRNSISRGAAWPAGFCLTCAAISVLWLSFVSTLARSVV